MPDDKELETLSDFVQSDGFALFGSHIQREWGPSGMRFQQSVREAAADQNAQVKLQIVLKVQEEILALMAWPKNRIEQLRSMQTPRHPLMAASRRGPGL